MKNNRMITCNNIIIAVNIAVFLILSLFGMTEDGTFMLQHGAMYTPFIMNGEYYRLFTCLFLHFGFSHLLNNMLVLYIMGQYLERELGAVKYLILYLFTGIGANLLSLYIDLSQEQYVISAGASGAIFGVIGAMLYIVIRNHGRLGTLTSKGLMIMIAISLYFGFTSSGVDNTAHIGGLILGFLGGILLYHRRRQYDRESSTYSDL